MTVPVRIGAVGAPVDRVEARDKVTGTARYAVEHRARQPAYAVAIQATVAKGRITSIDPAPARATSGVTPCSRTRRGSRRTPGRKNFVRHLTCATQVE